MSMETKLGPGQKPHPGTPDAFEHEDASPSSLIKAGIFLAVILIAVFLSMRLAFHLFAKITPMGADASPFENSRILPPRPRLQVDPQQEIHAYCNGQAEILDSYGWVDSGAGIVRIPIDRAMQLTVASRLTSRPAGEAPVGAYNAPSELAPAEGLGGQCGYLHEADERYKDLQKELDEDSKKAKHE